MPSASAVATENVRVAFVFPLASPPPLLPFLPPPPPPPASSENRESGGMLGGGRRAAGSDAEGSACRGSASCPSCVVSSFTSVSGAASSSSDGACGRMATIAASASFCRCRTAVRWLRTSSTPAVVPTHSTCCGAAATPLPLPTPSHASADTRPSPGSRLTRRAPTRAFGFSTPPASCRPSCATTTRRPRATAT